MLGTGLELGIHNPCHGGVSLVGNDVSERPPGGEQERAGGEAQTHLWGLHGTRVGSGKAQRKGPQSQARDWQTRGRGCLSVDKGQRKGTGVLKCGTYLGRFPRGCQRMPHGQWQDGPRRQVGTERQ